MLENLIIIVHILVCLALILIILLQTGKGAGMGAAFGGSSQTVFGSTGRASFLTKVTIVAAVVFGLTSLGLSFIRTQGTSVMDDYKAEPAKTAPEPTTLPNLPGGAVTTVPETPSGAMDVQPPSGAEPSGATPGTNELTPEPGSPGDAGEGGMPTEGEPSPDSETSRPQ